VPVQRSPEWKLGEVQSEIVTEQRLRFSVSHACPGQRKRRGPITQSSPDYETQHGSARDTAEYQDPGIERLTNLEIGKLAGDLNRSDGTEDDQQVADEPGTGDQDAAHLEGKAKKIPVHHEAGSLGRDQLCPPAIGEECGSPASHEEQDDERREAQRDRDPATAQTLPASQPRTSAWYWSREAASLASNRSTRTGWVLEARMSPQPLGKVMRTPSMLLTG